MIKLDKAVIVEGKYDKIKLSSIIDAPIIAVDGFQIYHDKEKQLLIKTFAKKTGVIIVTDSDVAGFRIRSYLKSILKNENVTHVYIPDIYGKEKRKRKASAEGKLGVEGVPAEILTKAFAAVGVPYQQGPAKRKITKLDFYEAGLYGRENSAALRKKLLFRLNLPEHLTVNSLLELLNTLMDYDTYQQEVQKL